MVEAPLELQRTLSIPQDHYDSCVVDGTPVKGNAAGNIINLLDLTGQNAPPGPLPEGFTTRVAVALGFSILSAFTSIAVISWYGLADI